MKMTMKKIISWGMMLAAAFTLTNCAKEINNPNEQPESAGYPFEIVASTVDTKTVNDGMSTKWAEGDQINLFHAIGETTDYKNDGAFIIADLEAGVFAGNLSEQLDVEEEYDWYAVYPYNSELTSPKNTTATLTVGKGLVQDGYGNTSHLAGEMMPLFGKAIASSGAGSPKVAMSHIMSVLAVNVTNNTSEAIQVNEVSFEGDGNYLAGSYNFDFSDEKVTFKPVEAETTATVTVKNAASLAAGESAIVYIPILPFNGCDGDHFTLTVNGEVTKVLYLDRDVTFAAGKIKTLNFSYEKEEEVPAFKAGKYWIVANGKYAMPITGNYGYLQVDNAGYTDNVFTISEVEGGYTIQQPDAKYLYMTGTYNSFNVSATAPSDNGHVWTIAQNEDGSYKILNVLKSKYIQLDSQYGTYGSYDTEKGTMPNLVPADAAAIRPIFTVDSVMKNVECTVTEASFNITSNQNWTVVPGEGVSVDVTSGSGNATVTLTFAENKSEEDVVYTATIMADGFDDIVLTVKQSGVPTGDEDEKVTIVLSAATRPCSDFPNTSTGVTTKTTYTIGDYEWTFSPSSGNKFSWYDNGDYILWGKSGGYILMPAIEGKKLTSVTILTGKQASTSVKVGVYNEAGTAAVSGGTAMTLNKQNAEFTWTLTGTEVNTHYQLRVTSAHNAQLQKLTLVYE